MRLGGVGRPGRDRLGYWSPFGKHVGRFDFPYTDTLVEKIAGEREVDYIDMMDPALMEMIGNMTPGDDLIAAMSTCGSITLTAERRDLTKAVCADMQAAAAERGR